MLKITFVSYKARDIFIDQEMPEPYSITNPSKTNKQ